MNTKTTVIPQEALQQQFAFCEKIRAIWHGKISPPKPMWRLTAVSRTKLTPSVYGAF